MTETGRASMEMKEDRQDKENMTKRSVCVRGSLTHTGYTRTIEEESERLQKERTTIRKKGTQQKEKEGAGEMETRGRRRVQDSFYYTTCAVDRWW